MELKHPWKCTHCHHANQAYEVVCHFCGGTGKVTLHPVRETNQMQGTPNHEELVESLDVAERNRHSDISIEEQVKELVRQFLQEAQVNNDD